MWMKLTYHIDGVMNQRNWTPWMVIEQLILE